MASLVLSGQRSCNSRHGPLMLLGPTMDPTVASKSSLRIPHLALRVAWRQLESALNDMGALSASLSKAG